MTGGGSVGGGGGGGGGGSVGGGVTGGGVTGGSGGGGGGAGGGASRTASPSSLLRGAPAAPGTVARTTVATAQRALGERRIAAARQV